MNPSETQNSVLRNAVIRLARRSQIGVQSSGTFLARLASTTAQEVMTSRTIPSTISGGPSNFQVHRGSGEVLHPGDEAAIYTHCVMEGSVFTTATNSKKNATFGILKTPSPS